MQGRHPRWPTIRTQTSINVSKNTCMFKSPQNCPIASADVLQRAQWPTLFVYYKLAIFICLHKAFHNRLPVTLIDLISKKRATNYSTRTCASLIVPRFNTRYMKDSVAFRGWPRHTIHPNGFRPMSSFIIIIWLCLTRTGNYRIHQFDWLKVV